MKKFTSFVLLITAILTFTACAAEGEITYKNDIPVSAISEAANTALENGKDMVIVPETYVTAIMDVNVANFTEYEVYKQVVGAVVDEYGIFKVKDASYIDTALASLNDYINTTRNESMVPQYMPEEQPKLDAAEVKAFGEYVVFCILSEEGKADVFDAVSKMITAK